MSDEFIPEPQTSGALVPPGRRPPTAIAVDTPEPEPAPYARHHSSGRIKSPAEVLRPLARAFAGALREAARALDRV